jgi:hypothetical protein
MIEDDKLPSYTKTQLMGFRLQLGEPSWMYVYEHPTDDTAAAEDKVLVLYDGEQTVPMSQEASDALVETIMGWKLNDALTFDPARYAEFGVESGSDRMLAVHYTYTKTYEDAFAVEENAFDGVARILSYIPGVIKKFVVWFLKLLDYFGLLPKALLNVSPFHGSMFITSMGSLGIPPIYHHLYNFGNVPVFIAFGAKRLAYELNSDFEPVRRRYIDYTVVVDERICDGFAYASAFKLFRRYMANPSLLDLPPETVVEDGDIDPKPKKKKEKKAKTEAPKAE